MLTLTVIPHPFTPDRHVLDRPAGGTLGEVLDSTGWPAEYADVLIDGVPVPRERWAWLRPEDGRALTLRIFPKGGGNSRGKNIGRIAAGVVLLVAAVVTQQYYGGAIAAGLITSGNLALAGTA